MAPLAALTDLIGPNLAAPSTGFHFRSPEFERSPPPSALEVIAFVQDAEVMANVAGHDVGESSDRHRVAVGVSQSTPGGFVQSSKKDEIARP